MGKRVVLVFSLMLLTLGGVMARLAQINNGSGIFTTAGDGAKTTVTVSRQRGTIYDRNHTPLVNTETEYRVCVAPYATELSEMMELLSNDQQIAVAKRLQTGRPAVQTVPQLLSGTEGILQFVTKSRYGKHLLAPHVIGYVGNDGVTGLSGIEAAFNERLNAAFGVLSVSYTVDGTGVPLKGIRPEITDTREKSDEGVVLTLDSTLQRVAEMVASDCLPRGAVVIMEPKSGEILASVSRPDFQPNTIGTLLNEPTAPLLNRVLSNYNCGSVFKIVTAAAALENGVSPEQVYTCAGHVTVGDTVFYCHNKLGHGALDMQEAFAQSCNCYFIQLAAQIGSVPVRQMAVALGFDTSYALAGTLGTACASLPTAAELTLPAELANLSFGQGSLLATPVHVARMLTAVVGNGVLQTPTLFRGYRQANGADILAEPTAPVTVFSERTAAYLQAFMCHTVNAGSGKAAMPKQGGAAGKTGTAETGWIQNGSDVVQSWFAGYYPAVNPRYIIVVLAEDKNNTGAVAAPIFKKMCDALEEVSE